MEIKEIEKAVYELATLEEHHSPLLSVYLDLSQGGRDARQQFEKRVNELRGTFMEDERRDFDHAVYEIEEYLDEELGKGMKGLVIFCRKGISPYFRAMKFDVGLRTEIRVNYVPSIYQLIEMKDVYHRFVVVYATERDARILEVHAGRVTEALLNERPELRKRVGREWTREHYQNHLRERGEKWLKEEMKVLEKIMVGKGYKHLILAGSDLQVNRVRKVIPKHLEGYLIEQSVSGKGTQIEEIVREAVEAFIQEEHRESLEAVEEMKQAILAGGLGLGGLMPTWEALRNAQVDKLILSKRFEVPWIRDELARLAVQQGVRIETADSELLDTVFNGVGCLLRYRQAGQYEGELEQFKRELQEEVGELVMV